MNYSKFKTITALKYKQISMAIKIYVSKYISPQEHVIGSNISEKYKML